MQNKKLQSPVGVIYGRLLILLLQRMKAAVSFLLPNCKRTLMDPDPGKSLRWRVSSPQLQHPGKGELRTQRRERQGQGLGLLTRFPIRHGGVCETGQRPKLAYAEEKSNLLRPKGAPPQEAAPPGTGDQTLVVNADPDLSDVCLDPWKRHRVLPRPRAERCHQQEPRPRRFRLGGDSSKQEEQQESFAASSSQD